MVSDILVGTPIGKHPLVIRRMKQEDNIKIIVNDRSRECEKFCWMKLDHDPVY
jgi:hypothetical protein